MEIIKVFCLFILTALAEIIGCYLPYLWLKQDKSVWLFTLHPHTTGRVYAAYGGIYIGVALMWLWVADSIKPTITDFIGVGICLVGTLIIMFAPHHA